MKKINRYAVYYAPRDGAFATAAAAWLGWDVVQGCAVPQPAPAGLPAPLAELTKAPRKYGFHGTIRAPFRLDAGLGPADAQACVANLARSQRPVVFPALRIENLHGFLAFTPEGDTTDLLRLGAEVVRGTNHLRAPLNQAELAKRQPDRLTPRQRDLLDEFGYPWVMEEFRFHLTLSDQFSPDHMAGMTAAARDHFADALPQPFVIEDLCLFGEDNDGTFHLIHRYALSG